VVLVSVASDSVGGHSSRLIKKYIRSLTEREMVPEVDSQSAKSGTCRHKLTAGVRGSAPEQLKVSVQYGAAQSARIGLGCELQRGVPQWYWSLVVVVD
jgi:hypothetical protein